MSDQEVTSEEVTHIIEAVDAFSKMVKKPESICKTNTDVLLALKCARHMEDLHRELRDKHLHFLFIQQMCKKLHVQEDSYDISTMQYACDTFVVALLTSNTVSSSSMLCCMNNYIELCGKERFTHLLSSIIIKSEACRVLLDFIGSIENDTQTSIVFQANILFRIVLAKPAAAVTHTIHEWLNSDAENRIAVAFQAILEAGIVSNISKAFIQGLVSSLEDRKETAALYLLAAVSSPVSLSILKESKSLFYASLDFLRKCAENFELTPHLTWSSCENGPCQTITFDMIVKYVHFLKSADVLVPLVDTFLIENCSLPGCTFWEDIIDSFPACTGLVEQL